LKTQINKKSIFKKMKGEQKLYMIMNYREIWNEWKS